MSVLAAWILALGLLVDPAGGVQRAGLQLQHSSHPAPPPCLLHLMDKPVCVFEAVNTAIPRQKVAAGCGMPGGNPREWGVDTQGPHTPQAPVGFVWTSTPA